MVPTVRRRVPLVLLVVGTIAVLSASILLLQLDRLVHGDLYRYGLQYSDEWAVPYWTYFQIVLVICGAVMLVNGLGVGYLLLRVQRGPQPSGVEKRPLSGGQRLSLVLLGGGVGALIVSLWYAQTLVAYIGLGLILWGGILSYVKSGRYVKHDLLNTTTMPSLTALSNLIHELGLKGQPLYLPPRYLRDVDASRVYIAREQTKTLPRPADVHDQERAFYVATAEGMIFDPPGVELTRLFERAVKTSFAEIELQDFRRTFSTAAIEHLELAGSVAMQVNGNELVVRLGKTPYATMCQRSKELPHISGLVGCPLCSAIACALAKTTGKLVYIAKEEGNATTDTIIVVYRFLPEPTE
jgi:hypothetical protein